MELLPDLLEVDPDRPALTFRDSTSTFGALDARSAQVAHALLRAGVRPGDRVAVLARNRPEFFELLFGAARAGAVLVPLNRRLAPPEIAAIAADARPVLALADVAGPLPGAVDLDTGYEAWIAGLPTTPPARAARADDVVLQLYSSGTTGRPKGVCLTHANLAFTPRMGRATYGMTPASVNLLASPLFHIGGAGYALAGLGQGAHTVLLPDADRASIRAAIARHRVTHAFFVPAVVRTLLDVPGDVSSLQLIAYGGAPMTETLLREAMDGLGCGFLGVYGMTETAGSVTALLPADHARPELLRSVGRALPWHEVAVFDPITGAPSPVGEVGEIRVRSGQNTPGYWRSPQETAATLLPDGWLCTGDAAYADAEGYLYLHDRIKDMIISGGENIYPAEVENALASHPAVADVAVVGAPSVRWGETVRAVVVPALGAAVTGAELIAHARTRIAAYKCPTLVDFTDALPRNASGKVLKRALRTP